MLEFLEVLVSAGAKRSPGDKGPGRGRGMSMGVEYGELRGVGAVKCWYGPGIWSPAACVGGSEMLEDT